jgi:hypothetical protein
VSERNVSDDEIQKVIEETCKVIEYGKREGLKAFFLARLYPFKHFEKLK